MPAEARIPREKRWQLEDTESEGYLRVLDDWKNEDCTEPDQRPSKCGGLATKAWTILSHRQAKPPFELEFEMLVQQWKRDTGKLSMLHNIVLHTAYQRIIGLGEKVLPLIFQELALHGGHWIWALSHITGKYDVAKPEHTFREAVRAWLDV